MGVQADDSTLARDIDRAVPRCLPWQIRQDVCQDIAVEVLRGKNLTPGLVSATLIVGRKRYGLREWDEVSLDAICQRISGRTWGDVLSDNNPIACFRPRRLPPPKPVLLRVKKGYTRGSSSPMAKLTEYEVVAMRHMYHTGRFSQKKLAKEFGVTQGTVYSIVTGCTWKHVGGPIYIPATDDHDIIADLVAHGFNPAGKRAWNLGTPPGTPPPRIKDDTRMSQVDQAFEEFWAIYPKRIAKLAALKAYQKARIVATSDEILAGLKGYLANLPDEPRYIAHAASWLNAGRWMDEYTVSVTRQPTDANWFEQCRELHHGECGGDRMRHHLRVQMEKAS